MYRYRSMVVWQRAHQSARLALSLTDQAYQPRARALFEQIRRAAISIEANIVEGYALGSTAQFRRHLTIARGSAAEAECLVRLAKEMGSLRGPGTTELDTALSRTLRLIQGLLKRLRARTS